MTPPLHKGRMYLVSATDSYGQCLFAKCGAILLRPSTILDLKWVGDDSGLERLEGGKHSGIWATCGLLMRVILVNR